MANNTGQPQQQLLYYAYAALPPGGPGQQYGGQDGMNPGQCDASQQPVMFGMPDQQRQFGYGEDGSGGNMPTMPMGQQMMTGQMGGVPQMMFMPTATPQQPQQMDQSQDQQPSITPSTSMQRKPGSSAFKIVDPKTQKEVVNDRAGGGTTPTAGQQASGNSSQTSGGGQQQGMQAPSAWPQQMSSQPSDSGPPPGGQQDGQAQQPPQQEQPPSQGAAAPQGQGAGGAGQSPQMPQTAGPAGAAGAKKKLLVNKKLPVKKSAEAGGEAPAAAAADSTAKSGGDTPGSVQASPAPSPEAAQRKPGESSAAKPAAEASKESGASGGGGGTGGTSVSGDKSAQIAPRWPPPPSGGQSSNFASSIKALNLEPMRAQPHRSKPMLGRAAPQSLNEGVRPLPDSAKQTSQEAKPEQSQSQDAKPEQSQSQPSPALPQTQPQQTQPSPVSPQNPGPQQLQQQPQQQQTPVMPQNQGPQQQPQQPQQPQPSPMMPQNQGPQQNQQPMQPQMSPMMPQNTGPQPNQQQPMQPQQMQQPQYQQMPNHMMMMQPGMQPIPMMQPGMPMMQMPMQPQMQPPPVQQPAAPAGPIKPKGVKLKNAVLARKPKTGEGEEEPSKDSAQPSPAAAGRSPEEPEKPKPISLKPANQVFDRVLMLRIWQVHKDKVHPQVQGLTTNARAGDKNGTPGPAGNRKPTRIRPSEEETMNLRRKDGSGGKSKPLDPMMQRSSNAYVVKEASDAEEVLERKTRSLLNKICPTNLKTIVQQLAQIELKNAHELDFVIRIIFEKALAEPHWCETYADMVFALQSKYPKFPAETEGDKAQTFTRVLLNTCQTEFENLPVSFEPTAEELRTMSPDELQKKRKEKDKAKANMKFIGNLLLRQLLAVKVIGQVVYELIGIKDSPPEEHKIECVCELLTSIGHGLDEQEHGKKLMLQFTARLMELKRQVGPDGKASFSKRVQFQIQDLLDLRANGWAKKMFKETAKKTSEIRNDANMEARQKAKKGVDVMFTTQIAGAKPAYMEDIANKARSNARREAPTKPDWDVVYVKKLFGYYAEDRDAQQLENMWKEGRPDAAQVKFAIDTIIDTGFNEKAKQDVLADVIAELLRSRCVSWPVLDESLSHHLEILEDLKIDLPFCDLFIQSLFAKLFQAFGRDAGKDLLRPLPSKESDFHWKLLCGALKKLKERQGADGVQRAVDNVPQLRDKLCALGDCNSGQVKKRLQDEGCL